MRGKGIKLGEHCPKVRLSQDRMPIEPFRITGFLYVFGIFTSFGIVTYGSTGQLRGAKKISCQFPPPVDKTGSISVQLLFRNSNNSQ